jgi:hypothetical protein
MKEKGNNRLEIALNGKGSNIIQVPKKIVKMKVSRLVI